jgi:hypothetical protein
MTVARFLGIFYKHAARYERWRRGEPPTHAERIEQQKQDAADGAAAEW